MWHSWLLLTALCWFAEPQSEAESLVQRLRSLPDYRPTTLERSDALRRLIVLDAQAVPALEAALQSPHVPQRAAAAIALKAIARTKPVARLLDTEQDAGLRLLFRGIFQMNAWLDSNEAQSAVSDDELSRAGGPARDEIKKVLQTKVVFSTHETQERCTRLMPLLDGPAGGGEGQGTEHDRARGILCTLGNDAMPLMCRELRSVIADSSPNGMRALSLALAVKSNVDWAVKKAPTGADDARLLGLNHEEILQVALQGASSAEPLARTGAAYLLGTIAAFEHERLSEYAARAEKRLLELGKDSNVKVSQAAEQGIRRRPTGGP